jgi:hypothetical protein
VIFAILLTGFAASPERRVGCGAFGAHMLARELGRHSALEETTARLPDQPAGHSMRELQSALLEWGVRTEARFLKPSAAKLPKGPLIAHFNSSDKTSPGHFVFIRPLEPTFAQYQLVAPGSDPEVLFADQILSHPDFSGWVLRPAEFNVMFFGGVGLVVTGAVLWVAPRSALLRRNLNAKQSKTYPFTSVATDD